MCIGFVGSGAMVTAIARGGVAAGMNASDFLFTDTYGVRAPVLAVELGASVASSNGSLAHQVNVLVLGVKPHVQSAVIKMVAHIVRERPEVYVVSLAAGCTVEPIAKDSGVAVPTVRVMPNANTQIGRSVSTVYPLGASGRQVATVEAPMNKAGRSIRIKEKNFPAFQVLIGCSPTWVFQTIETLARTGVEHGLAKKVSIAVVAQALTGSISPVLEASEQGTVPPELIDKVCSSGGAAIAGLFIARTQGISMCLTSAVETVITRDAEISTRTR